MFIILVCAAVLVGLVWVVLMLERGVRNPVTSKLHFTGMYIRGQLPLSMALEAVRADLFGLKMSKQFGLFDITHIGTIGLTAIDRSTGTESLFLHIGHDTQVIPLVAKEGKLLNVTADTCLFELPVVSLQLTGQSATELSQQMAYAQQQHPDSLLVVSYVYLVSHYVTVMYRKSMLQLYMGTVVE